MQRQQQPTPMLQSTDFQANSRGRYKVKFRNVGLRFPTVEALKSFFSRFGSVEDVHLEDEMPAEDHTLDDGKYILFFFS